MKNINTNDKDEIKELKKLMKTTRNKRLYIRYQTITLHLRGYSNKHISHIVDLCGHTVGTYIRRYKENGIAGLVPIKQTGKPKRLTDEQEKELVKVITTKTPDEVGFKNRKNWDTNIACKWVSDTYNVEYTSRGMLDVLYRLDLSYTRPTYTLAKADPKKQEEFKEKFECLKKTNK